MLILQIKSRAVFPSLKTVYPSKYQQNEDIVTDIIIHLSALRCSMLQRAITHSSLLRHSSFLEQSLVEKNFLWHCFESSACFTSSFVDLPKRTGLSGRTSDLTLPLCYAGPICLAHFGLSLGTALLYLSSSFHIQVSEARKDTPWLHLVLYLVLLCKPTGFSTTLFARSKPCVGFSEVNWC